MSNALAVQYRLAPTAANKTWGDTVYGSLWGYAPYNTGNVYSDSLSPAANQNLATMSDAYVNEGKWYGFFAGMGMAFKWPAARLGGVASAVNGTVQANLQLGSAASARIVVTAPSGATSTIVCSSIASCSAVSIPVDNRQGSDAYTIQYLSANGTVLSTVTGVTPEITTPAALVSGAVGTSYPVSLAAMGGAGTLTWSLASGNLPPGLSLSSAGDVSGIPVVSGTFSFVIQAVDTLGFAASANFTLTINP